jgi:hypothetical protein
LNQPHLYSSIFISIEEETELQRFQPEDLYLLLLLKLIEFIDDKGIEVNKAGLKLLSEELFRSEEVKEQLKTYSKGELSAEAGGGIDFFGWLKAKANFKTVFGVENAVTREVRKTIQLNLIDFILKVNFLLVDVRYAMQQKGIGNDLLFIIDGSEKVPESVYESVFVKNANVLKELSCNMVLSVSIHMWYSIPKNADFIGRELLPMLKMGNPETLILLEQVVSKRLDTKVLFEPDALPVLIKYSGGCLRQLFILCNYAIVRTLGERKVNVADAEAAALREGQRLYEALHEKHLAVIEKTRNGEQLPMGNPDVSTMLYGLVLLKYNGNYAVNPVVDFYMNQPH